ncbi:MAG: hypothetical protein VKO39_12195 [Cyanobacteriota bacterium]|nr:hypothetical protein [Cyanobacteriota bacterium]
MATKLSLPPHRPTFPRSGVVGGRSRRFHWCAPAALPLPCQRTSEQGADPAVSRGWQRRALREGVLVTLLTSLLTSAVLASPELFRQSPAVSWNQRSSLGLAVGDLPARGPLLDCP